MLDVPNDTLALIPFELDVFIEPTLGAGPGARSFRTSFILSIAVPVGVEEIKLVNKPSVYVLSEPPSGGPIIPAEPAPPTDENYYDGLIAQEVSASLSTQGITSDIWKENDLGKQSVKYGSLTVPLIKAVQELTARVEALEAQINGEM